MEIHKGGIFDRLKIKNVICKIIKTWKAGKKTNEATVEFLVRILFCLFRTKNSSFLNNKKIKLKINKILRR
jgi:hypothetical protein